MIAFLVWWFASMALLFGCLVSGINYDIVAVFVLRCLNAPVYQEARLLAGAIYRHPEQWTMTAHHIEHAQIGAIRYITSSSILHVDGPGFGHWEPTALERRIIFDACRWYRRVYIRSLVGAALERTP